MFTRCMGGGAAQGVLTYPSGDKFEGTLAPGGKREGAGRSPRIANVVGAVPLLSPGRKNSLSIAEMVSLDACGVWTPTQAEQTLSVLEEVDAKWQGAGVVEHREHPTRCRRSLMRGWDWVGWGRGWKRRRARQVHVCQGQGELRGHIQGQHQGGAG
jgi:hypothetical protein